MAKPKECVRLHWMLKPLAVRPRLDAAIAIGLATGLAVHFGAPQAEASTALICAWDGLSVSFITFMLFSMARHDPVKIRARAARDDEGRGMILMLIVLAAVASVVAIAAELSLAKTAHGASQILHVALAFGTVAASWLMMQLIFAVHYAHEYYDPNPADASRDAEGLLFPGGEPPDYWDFLHFSIVIGVAAQTADVAFTSKELRRLGTVHSLVAFAFNTVIVALTINLLAGLF